MPDKPISVQEIRALIESSRRIGAEARAVAEQFGNRRLRRAATSNQKTRHDLAALMATIADYAVEVERLAQRTLTLEKSFAALSAKLAEDDSRAIGE